MSSPPEPESSTFDAALARRFANEERVDRREIRLRLVQKVDHALEFVRHLRAGVDRMQIDAQMPGCEPGVRQIVHGALFVKRSVRESHREAIERPSAEGSDRACGDAA